MWLLQDNKIKVSQTFPAIRYIYCCKNFLLFSHFLPPWESHFPPPLLTAPFTPAPFYPPPIPHPTPSKVQVKQKTNIDWNSSPCLGGRRGGFEFPTSLYLLLLFSPFLNGSPCAFSTINFAEHYAFCRNYFLHFPEFPPPWELTSHPFFFHLQ